MNIPGNYKIIHQNIETDQYLVLNEITNEVCLLKLLKNYDINVYKKLKGITSIHIPKIYEILEDNDELMVIEEYINGDTLEDRLLKNALDNSQKQKILLELCDSLELLHKAPYPIIHRDLKTTNIMLTKEGVIKLIDYDAAKIYHDGNSKDTVLLGTPSVAAPEQYGFAQSDVRTDVFAMGKLIDKFFPNDRKYKPIIQKATRLDPQDRYQNIKELRNALTGNRSGNFINRLLTPPGFRTFNWLHMVPAIVYYFFTIAMVYGVTFMSENSHYWSFGRRMYYFFQTLLVFLSIVDIEFQWTGIWEKVPFVKSKDTITHVLSGIGYWIIIVILCRLSNDYLVDILFP